MSARRSLPRALATLIALLLLPAMAHAQAQAPAEDEPPAPTGWRETSKTVGAVTFDVLLLRPLEVVAAAVGCAAFVPVAVITAPGGLDALEEALDLLVVEPGRTAFTRPLGDF